MAETTKTSDQNLMAALTYLLGFVTGIIFLLVEKKNNFVRFHAMQSTLTFGGLFVVNVVLNLIPALGQALSGLLGLLGLVLWVVLMVQAFRGVKYKLPYIGDYAERYAK